VGLDVVFGRPEQIETVTAILEGKTLDASA